MTTPNTKQQELIDHTDGVYVVDAGAGTGKTFTVTRRYAEIVAQPDVEPEDVLLVTFTNNAATEMRERIVAQSDTYGVRELADAPIQTFHSHCHDILTGHGFDAPSFLGIDDHITDATRILEDESVEVALFREFINRFSDDHPEYDDQFRAVTNPIELLGLITQLAAKGVFPTADGWYRNGERHLGGDFDAFQARFDDLNEPRNDGGKQSTLRSKLGGFGRDSCYLPNAPASDEIRGEYGSKQVPRAVARFAFEGDRDHLKAFVHDVYHEYLAFALRRNYLNFSFLQLFAFVLLCEDHALRDDLAHEYVMVDEFQDSSVIQFKLALLLAATDNLCVVGDWKQSIYSFQYAAVENITEFDARLDRFVRELNDDHERITWTPGALETIELEENYRSTQAILDFSEHTLVTPATGGDDVTARADEIRNRIVPLSSNADVENSRIEAIQHEDEHEAVLTKIQDIVGNPDYAIEADGDLREPEYGDVAVLTRTRDYGRELLSVAEAHDLPMSYEGGIELFRTDAAKLLLAWLRILETDADRGWAVVLEEAGYTLDEVRHVLDTRVYPEDMAAFRERLGAMATVGGVAERVLSRYGFDGPTADVLLTTIESIRAASTLTRGGLIRVIERGIEDGSTHEVSTSAGTDAVTVQTIHAAKGLEHPIVVLANMNAHRFPSRGGSSRTITFDDPIGLRQRTVFDDAHGLPHLYDNWRADVLRATLPSGYDEERRLLYVATTRAEHHLVFAAGETPNTFLEELPVEVETLEPNIREPQQRATRQAHLQISIPDPAGPVDETPHTLMRDDVFEGVTDGRGPEFGTRVHEFAENYARAIGAGRESTDREPVDHDEEHVAAFIDSLNGDLRIEEGAVLPLDVDGERVTISGVVDLVAITPDRVEVVDLKTDLGDHAQAEYRKQLSVYYHVLASAFPDRDVTASILYTHDGTRVKIDPLSMPELVGLVRDRRSERTGGTPSGASGSSDHDLPADDV